MLDLATTVVHYQRVPASYGFCGSGATDSGAGEVTVTQKTEDHTDFGVLIGWIVSLTFQDASRV